MRQTRRLAIVLLFVAAPAFAQSASPIQYKVSFPAPVHRWAQVEVTFTGVPAGPLEARMSRSSPGRYALHEFAKNVWDVHAFEGSGREVPTTRPNPYQWNVADHDATVRIVYKVYGDHVDGTYLAIDRTHAHMNMPALLMWASGLEDRPVRITFEPPAGVQWKAATQLFPTNDPWTFTAPNLQYLFDSPTELSAFELRQFTMTNPDGKTYTIRAAVHADATPAEIDAYADGVKKIVAQAQAVYGELPAYDTGTYTFLADYLPWNDGDGMEHRNSTVVTGTSLGRALNTASHEFFHCWNVERIRPQGLEPFDFSRANMTDSLWLAEGFTQYYGALVSRRAGLTGDDQTIATFGRLLNAVVNSEGRQFRSAVDLSHMAPFVDAARAVDRTNFSNTFISYYTYGGAIALALDLTLRDRSDGRITLDDFMRAMWRKFGKPGGPEPGLVAHPYSLQDVEQTLAEVSGDAAFADEFYTRYIAGRDVVDYARLLQRAGVSVHKRSPGEAWMGDLRVGEGGTIAGLVPWDSPAYDAGVEQDDVITDVGGTPVTNTSSFASALRAHKPGDRVAVTFKRRNGQEEKTTVTLEENPALVAVPMEKEGGTLTPAQQAFREAWLGARNAR